MAYSCCAYQLRCNECGRRFGNQPLSACDDCLAPLELTFDLEVARKTSFTRAGIASGPHSIWRYSPMLPVPEEFRPDLPVGFTPLLRAKSLGRRLGAANLYLKNDAVCFPP